MFTHAYDSYMRYAFPHDELKPLSGTWTDSLAELGNSKATSSSYTGVAMTLIDSLSTLGVMRNSSQFTWATKWLCENIDFNQDVRVNVFEANIRLLGGLLSAHTLATDKSLGLITGTYHYSGCLLTLATDLGDRLMRAFDSPYDLPYAWVNLKSGVEDGETRESCVAGAGTLLLEFGLLSHLTGDMRYYEAADRAIMKLWKMKSNIGLLGNTFELHSGAWRDPNAGIGAGVDSFYEYLLKGKHGLHVYSWCAALATFAVSWFDCCFCCFLTGPCAQPTSCLATPNIYTCFNRRMQQWNDTYAQVFGTSRRI